MVLVVLLYGRVRDEAVKDDSQPAGAVVVFGAAEYAGRPSPTLRARLDHALSLYKRGLAAKIRDDRRTGRRPEFHRKPASRAITSSNAACRPRTFW